MRKKKDDLIYRRREGRGGKRAKEEREYAGDQTDYPKRGTDSYWRDWQRGDHKPRK